MVAPDADSPRPSPLTAAVHIFALWAFAVAEPLFGLLSRQAEFFVAHDAQPFDLVLIGLLLSVALPAALFVFVQFAGWLYRSARHWAHLAVVGGLLFLIALQLVKRPAPGAPGGLLVAAAVALAVASTAGYRRWRAFRTFLTWVSPMTLLSPALFLFASPVGQIVLPSVRWAGLGDGTSEVPVVMVVLDELPLSSLLDESNEIDPLRYPNLAALARDAYWYRDATTVARKTVLSVPIILSGRIPDRSQLPLAEHYPDNLFTWLAGAGYRMRVFETQTRICPRELCTREETRPGFAERFDAMATDLAVIYLHLLLPAEATTRLPAIDATWHNFTQRTIGDRLKQLRGTPVTSASARRRDTPGLFAAFLESIDRDPRPGLYFIHLMLPHVPWKYLPSGKEYGPVGASMLPHGIVNDAWGADRWEVVQGYQRHLLQLGYVDALVGRLLVRLKQQDLYDSALIILVADHGARFRPQARRRAPTAEHFADILNVPLMIKLPGQRRGVLSERNVETIDILPTVADVLDLALPWPADGQSAIDSGVPERRRKFTLGAGREDGFERQPWDIEALRADREQSVANKLRLFGPGPDGLFQIGRRADLLRRRVLQIGVVDPPSEPAIDIQLDQVWSYEEVDPESPFIPAHVTGRARFAQPRDVPMEFAVAVNGTIEAVTRTFDHTDDRARFTAMVREEAWLAGRNLVEVFEIRGHRETTVLVSTRQPETQDFILVQGPGGEAIQSAAGVRIPLVEGYLKGRAKFIRGAMGTRLSGWAGRGRQQPAETLLVFIAGRLALVTELGLAPLGHAPKAMKPWRRAAGFRIPLPDAVLVDSEEIRLVAILGDTASEITVRHE